MVDERKLYAVTMGDAAGIGPEVVVKALGEKSVYDICRPVVIGDSGAIRKTISSLNNALSLNCIDTTAQAKGQPGTIDLLDMKNLPEDFTTGQVSAACGKAAMECIKKAADLVQSGEAAAMTTAPINKEAVKAAGYKETEHTRYLCALTNTTESASMLATGNLRAVHLSTHFSLKEACTMVTRERILSKLRLINDSFLKWGLQRPKIGVAALNPHGSDSGMFGDEEATQIAPAVQDAVAEDIDARGPYPADSIFYRAIGGEFDVVLAMYHDQGHIAVKSYGFEKSYTVTLGIPFVRTSVDHGTAFDIAGKGIADHQSMVEAIKIAVQLTR